MTEETMEAIRSAHEAAECGDYYCGCWDGPHATRFLAALRERGYVLVEAPNDRT